MTVTTTERGWPGHYICGHRCLFRRNTLLTAGDRRIVVSTVGLQQQPNFETKRNGQRFTEIGCGRHFETMAFEAKFDGRYWDADVGREVSFDSPCSQSEIDADDRANEMHDAVVAELRQKLEAQA